MRKRRFIVPSGGFRLYPAEGLGERFFRRRGITLLETMIVLAVLAVLLAFTVPIMRGTHQRNQLATAAREFTILARYARQQAILRGQTVEIQIELPKNKYRLQLDLQPERLRSRSSARETRSAMEEDRYLDRKQGRIFFKSIACATDPFGRDQIARIRFQKDGSASPTQLVIAGFEKRQMTIEISGASGAVRVYEGPPETLTEVSLGQEAGGKSS